MTDPTGRHHDDPPPRREMDPDAPLPTDQGVHPLAGEIGAPTGEVEHRSADVDAHDGTTGRHQTRGLHRGDTITAADVERIAAPMRRNSYGEYLLRMLTQEGGQGA